MSKRKIVPERFAIFAIDPGGTTGCASGVFRTDKGDMMLKDVIGRAVKKGVISSWEVRGPTSRQARELLTSWKNYQEDCWLRYKVPFDQCYLVIESFQLRTAHAHLEPVMIIDSMKTLMMGADDSWPYGKPCFQTPSTAKRVTNARLKDLGVWAVGSTHQRDALRHIVAKVSDIL